MLLTKFKTVFSTMIIFPLLENIVYLILYLITAFKKFYLSMNSSLTQLQTVHSCHTDRIKRLSITSTFWIHFSHSLLRAALNSGPSPSCRDWLCLILRLEPMPFLSTPQWLCFDRTTLPLSSGERVLKRLPFWEFTCLKLSLFHLYACLIIWAYDSPLKNIFPTI